jgi:hypothetical protein
MQPTEAIYLAFRSSKARSPRMKHPSIWIVSQLCVASSILRLVPHRLTDPYLRNYHDKLHCATLHRKDAEFGRSPDDLWRCLELLSNIQYWSC